MLDKNVFRMFPSYAEIDDMLGSIRDHQQRISEDRLTIEAELLAHWITIDHLESATGLTRRAVKSKILDASLVGLLWEKQWYLLRESLEDNGYDI